ncbi:MAG: hypothetical protein R2873_20885 [Caldilineaceae bacterium]
MQPSRLGDEVEVIFVPRTDADPRYPVDPYADLNDGLDAIADPAEREATRWLRLRQIVWRMGRTRRSPLPPAARGDPLPLDDSRLPGPCRHPRGRACGQQHRFRSHQRTRRDRQRRGRLFRLHRQSAHAWIGE